MALRTTRNGVLSSKMWPRMLRDEAATIFISTSIFELSSIFHEAPADWDLLSQHKHRKMRCLSSRAVLSVLQSIFSRTGQILTSAKSKELIVQVLEFMLFAEYFQFNIQDAETDDTLPVHWEADDQENMVLVGDRVVGVRTVREVDVPVSLELLDSKPDDEENIDSFDHVIECSLLLESGKLIITATSEDVYEAQRLDVEAGTYGVRIYWSKLDEIDGEGFEGNDEYLIRMWHVTNDDEPPAFKIVKSWSPPRPI